MYRTIGSGITPNASGLTLLATATPSAATVVTFNSIPTGYKNLYLVWKNVTGTLNAFAMIRLNNSTTGHTFYGTSGSGTGDFGIGASGSVQWGFGDLTLPIQQGYGNFTVFDYSNTVEGKSCYWNSRGGSSSTVTWGFFNSATPVSRIDIIPSTNYSPFVVSGKFFLYGVI